MAEEQDHDDLALIANAQTKLQTKVYGQFFIAELISSQNQTKKSLVMEVGGRVVGIMVVSDEIDYATIIRNFDTSTYN